MPSVLVDTLPSFHITNIIICVYVFILVPQLDREHEAYCRLQSQQRPSFPTNPSKHSKKVPVIHSNSNTQMETLPAGSGNPDTSAEDNAQGTGGAKLPPLPPLNKHVSKSKSSPSSLKGSSPPAKKKVVAKPKLPTRTGHKLPVRASEATSEGSEESLPSVREDNVAGKVQQEQDQAEGEGKDDQEQKEDLQRRSMPTADDDDDDMYEEPLPGLNTITPPTKNRSPVAGQVLTAEDISDQEKEARDLLAMSNSMNVDARLQHQAQSRTDSPQQYESLKTKAAGSVSSFSNKSPSTAKVSVEGGPPVVHKPNDFDPESIDTICAEIYERKQQNGCTKFPLCLCNQTPCAKKSLTSSLRIKKASYHKSL